MRAAERASSGGWLGSKTDEDFGYLVDARRSFPATQEASRVLPFVGFLGTPNWEETLG